MKYNFDEIIDRANHPQSFSMKWSSRAAQRLWGTDKLPEDAICLQTADMDFKVAPEILEDLQKVIEHGILGYSMMNDTYREAVCHWYKTRQNWTFPKEDIYFTAGTHTAVEACVKKLTNENEGVIILTPCYSYHGDVEKNNRKYVTVDMINTDNYYTVDFEKLEEACKNPENTMLILCHPHNPTGRVYTKEELLKITELCRANNVIIVSDEVHSDILRKGVEFYPLMGLVGPEGVVACTAVNKTFNLAGLAMTNMIISDPILKERMGQFGMYSLPSPFGVQAVISAYTKGAPWVEALNEYVDGNLEYFVNFFNEHLPKAKVIMPEGGYIVWINFSGYGLSDEEIMQKFTDAHIVVQNGKGFDAPEKGQWIRMNLPSPRSVIVEACNRIEKAFNN